MILNPPALRLLLTDDLPYTMFYTPGSSMWMSSTLMF